MQGPVLQPFSYDEAHPYASGQHRGVDIGADAVGEAVVAPAAGTVSFAGTVPTNGKTVTIETADGYSVTLTHLGSIAVPKGATVAEEDSIGTIGPSGTPEVDAPYVHLGIRITADPNGYVDPLGLLPPAPADAATETGTTASQPASGERIVGCAREQAGVLVAEDDRGWQAPEERAASRCGASFGSGGRIAAQKPRADARTTRSRHSRAARDRTSDRRDPLPAAGRRAGGSQADRSRRRSRVSAERGRRAAGTPALQSAACAPLQLGRRAVRARCGVCRATASLESAPKGERPGPAPAPAGSWPQTGVARGLEGAAPVPETPQKILVAVAWPYASGPRHLGHVAGPGVPSDVFARYHRLKGNDVLMVSGTDEHGTPVMVSADREGVTPRQLADRNNALILDDYVRLGMTYDCFTRTTTRQPLRRRPEHVPHAVRQGVPHRADDARGDRPRDGTNAPRPLHRGHLPDLRLRRGAGRPVRQLRQPARSCRPDQTALDRGWLDSRVPRDDAPVPRSARVSRTARRVDRGADALAAERPQLRAQPRAGGEAPRDDPRHRLGRPSSRRGLPRGHRSASTSGSTR